MTNEQVLQGAMEVFNESIMSGNQQGDSSQGQQGTQSGGPLDRTASGTGTTASSGQIENATGQSSGDSMESGGEGGTGQQTAGGAMEGMESAGMDGTGSNGDDPFNGEQGESGTGTENIGGYGNEDGTGIPGSGQFPGEYGTGQQQSASGNPSGTLPGSVGNFPGGQQPGANSGSASAYPGGSSTQGTGSGYDQSGRRIIIIGDTSGVMTDRERVEQYDRELEEQMQVFDGIILGRRQESIARSNEEGAGDIPSSAPGGGGFGGDGTFESAPLLTTASASPSIDPNNNRTGGVMPDAPGDNREGDFQNQSGESSNIPPDIADGSDDDIVARQLREAAMAEQDPELREKLWDEYRKYKQGVQARR